MNVKLINKQNAKKNNTTVELIKADNPVKKGEMWKFSFMDKIVLFSLFRGTFIFPQGLDSFTMKLKLKELLNLYPHLAGRIVKKEGIRMNNQGVKFTEEENLKISVNDINNMDKPSEYFADSQSVKKVNKGIEPLMSIKITKIIDASVLSIQYSHSALDAQSFFQMVYNWSLLCQGKMINKPVVDQSLYPKAGSMTKKETAEKSREWGWKKISPLKISKLIFAVLRGSMNKTSRGFYFSPQALDKLKRELEYSTGYKISTFIALSSVITHLLIKLCKHRNNTIIKQISVLNMRERHENFPAEFAGNPVSAIATDDFHANSGIPEIARHIAITLEPYREKPSEKLKDHYALDTEIVHYFNGLISNFDIIENGFTMKPKVISCNSQAKYHIYDIDFGTGTPSLVLRHDPIGSTLIWPAPPPMGGLEVYFNFRFGELIDKLSENDPWLKEIQKYSE